MDANSKDVFCYFFHPANDYTKTVIVMPEDLVEGWKYEDYVANGYKTSQHDSDQIPH